MNETDIVRSEETSFICCSC